MKTAGICVSGLVVVLVFIMRINLHGESGKIH